MLDPEVDRLIITCASMILGILISFLLGWSLRDRKAKREQFRMRQEHNVEKQRSAPKPYLPFDF